MGCVPPLLSFLPMIVAGLSAIVLSV